MVPGFFFHPRMMEYDFGPRHPLKPVRLARTVALLKSVAPETETCDPGYAEERDILRVHTEAYLETVRLGPGASREELAEAGLEPGDTPAFPNMFEASMAYCGGAVAAANRLLADDPLAFNIAGGLHHAQKARASGFCVFNDPAIALSILKSRFSRLLYIDIDLHHGDGVQAIFQEDPDVATFSIHESGKTLYPGTGFLTEEGAGGSVVNIPLDAGTTGDVWLWAFREVFLPYVDWFRPQAIVLQMGCDAHTLDPLGHLQVSVQDWLGAVELVRATGLPVLACGGGGYEITNVPRMWVAAILTLAGLPIPEGAPSGIPPEWGAGRFLDLPPEAAGYGLATAQSVVEFWKAKLG